MNANEIDWFLLEGYAAGTATPAERLQVERWIAARAEHQRIFVEVRAALRARQHRHSRDWRRAEAIAAVMSRVRAGSPEPAPAAVLRRQRPAGGGPAAEQLMQRIRRWFEGASELAAAMLLDGDEGVLTDGEVAALRDKIDAAKRGKS